jgi:hypothetical protein
MKYDAIAGISVGEPRNTAVLVGDDGSTKKLIAKNRQLYVKKCLRPEQMGGIILTDQTRSDTVFALVLAISDDCGKFHKLTKEQKRRGESPSVIMDIEPNMKVVCPDKHDWGIIRSQYGTEEFFIREDIVKFAVEDE